MSTTSLFIPVMVNSLVASYLGNGLSLTDSTGLIIKAAFPGSRCTALPASPVCLYKREHASC